MKCSSQNAQSTSSDFSYIRSVPLVFVQRNICDVLRFKSGCGSTPHAVITSHPNTVIPSAFTRNLLLNVRCATKSRSLAKTARDDSEWLILARSFEHKRLKHLAGASAYNSITSSRLSIKRVLPTRAAARMTSARSFGAGSSKSSLRRTVM
jgi:hypothetical protein